MSYKYAASNRNEAYLYHDYAAAKEDGPTDLPVEKKKIKFYRLLRTDEALELEPGEYPDNFRIEED